MILLFEDNKDTPSSKLLINSLGGDSIKFSSGASRLTHRISGLTSSVKRITFRSGIFIPSVISTI